jgi:hypothetical protein
MPKLEVGEGLKNVGKIVGIIVVDGFLIAIEIMLPLSPTVEGKAILTTLIIGILGGVGTTWKNFESPTSHADNPKMQTKIDGIEHKHNDL